MKKTYQNPELKIVKIQSAKIIAASLQLGIGDTVTSANGAEARGHRESVWDDDEDFEQ